MREADHRASMLLPKREILTRLMQSFRCDGPVTEKKWRGQKVGCATVRNARLALRRRYVWLGHSQHLEYTASFFFRRYEDYLTAVRVFGGNVHERVCLL